MSLLFILDRLYIAGAARGLGLCASSMFSDLVLCEGRTEALCSEISTTQKILQIRVRALAFVGEGAAFDHVIDCLLRDTEHAHG